MNSGASSAVQKRSQIVRPVVAMLMCPSVVLNTPVGMLVGWLLPACFGTSPSISQRAPWKSSMKICACSSEVATCWPLLRLFPLEQRHQDAERAEDAGREVGDRDADAHRPLAGQAGDRHQPAHPLRDLVEAGPVAIGAGLAEPGDAGIDELRVDPCAAACSRCRAAVSRRGGNSPPPRRPSSPCA